MASSDHLSIDPSGVRGAAANVATGATTAGTAAVAITPSAQDVTSVLVANVLGGLVSDLINDTVAANTIAAVAAGRLSDNADSYEQQEHENASALSDTGRGGPGAASIAGGSEPSLVPPAAIPAPTTAGTTPTSGREIAQLIHGGPGPGALAAAAALLRTHAGRLDQAAGSIRSARWQNEASWSSDAADAAQRHLVNLEASYTSQAEQARGLADQASTQVENFQRAKNSIPSPQHFDDLERRLMAANRANNAPGSVGRFSGVVAKYQTDLAEANVQATNGFGGYTGGAAEVTAMQVRPKVATATGGPGPMPEGTLPDDGQGQDIDTAGSGVPGGDPAAELLGAPSGAASDVMSTLLPAVLGGVAGVAGGLLGALSGAGQKIQQAGSQLAGGLAQGASSAMGAMQNGGGGSEPDTSGNSGSGGDPSGDLGDGGGGDPGAGGTEPASSVDGPLSAAPASAAAAPAAAPAMYSATAPAADLAAAGGGGGAGAPMGGAMMPPMMGGRGGGAGQDDGKLYPERKLKLETPPNSEPVRLRREQRAARTERGD
jgi:PPE family